MFGCSFFKRHPVGDERKEVGRQNNLKALWRPLDGRLGDKKVLFQSWTFDSIFSIRQYLNFRVNFLLSILLNWSC